MKKEDLYQSINGPDGDIIEGSEQRGGKSAKTWIRRFALAACLGGMALAVFILSAPQKDAAPPDQQPLTSPQNPPLRAVQPWTAELSPADYFKFCGLEEEVAIMADSMLPYTTSRDFSDRRSRLEAEEVIPRMEEYRNFYCSASYNEDGSLYNITFSWHRRDEMYSDLSFIASYREAAEIEDCIVIELDEQGNVITPAVTVTEREGILIVAEGNENRNKTVTFQNDQGWYQIKGSFNDSYEPLIELLDWLWEHPVDFSRFTMEAGDTITWAQLPEHPHAFAGYIPDFAAYGFTEEWHTLTLKNGVPFHFEANYVAHADAAKVQESAYYDTEGWTNIHWCIDTEQDYYILRESLGELRDLTEQAVTAAIENDHKLVFTWDGYMIQIFSNTPQELWQVLQSACMAGRLPSGES